ncbi:MAG: ABC transporter permease [Dehalococcoidia bacterium]|nr:ABC transporter permease [Dehalococcoidia bacterium]
MQRYIIMRVLQALLVLVVVSVIAFALGHAGGNPLDAILPDDADATVRADLEEFWGINKPLHEQYFTYVWNAVRGDFGNSFKYPQFSVSELIQDRFLATIQLAGAGILVAVVIGLPIGVLTATYRDSVFDWTGKIVALLGQSLPVFWLGIVLMWIFAVQLDWFPTSGKGGIRNLILPAVAIGWFQVAAMLRLVRSSMLDVLDSEYVKLARIKGLPERKIIWKHCLRNASIAPLTYFAITLGSLMVGSVSIETVFQWPGLGFLLFNAARSSDYALLQGIMLTFTTIYIVANLLVDISYAYLDPRIRYN